MQLKYTVYNCGTGCHRSSPDIVPQLWKETASLKTINDGPGCGQNINPGNAWTISGLLGGKGVDANVERAIAEITKKNTVSSMVLNLCGWSRGAVTCFKIANALHKNHKANNIKCNIFAIDPVPGGSFLNNHMWNNIDVTPNIGMCSVVISQHERRKLFSPYFPPIKGPFTDVDVMPGDHGTIVEDIGRNREAHQLVKHMAKQFLISRGTVFHDSTLLSDRDILEKYAQIAENFEDYAEFAKGSSWLKSKRFDGERKVLDIDKRKFATILPVKPAFFINEHHREVFKRHFPQLGNEIDKPILQAFKLQNWNSHKGEFNRLMSDYQSASKMVLFFIMTCRAKHL